MEKLARILSPIDPNIFLHEYWGKNFLRLSGQPDKFREILTIEEFRNLVTEYSPFLASPRVTMYANGEILHESRFTRGDDVRISGALGYKEEMLIDLQKISSLLTKGATLKISQADKFATSLKKIAFALSDEINERVHINIYYSSPGTNAFDPHFDKHDVFILQIHGEKLWQVFEYQEKAPLPGIRKRKTSAYLEAPKHEFLLSPGHLLYLPRGMWHYAHTTNRDSLHITIGIECATTIELMRWIVDYLIIEDDFRTNLPRTGEISDDLSRQIYESFMGALQSKDRLNQFYRERRGKGKQSVPSFHTPDF